MGELWAELNFLSIHPGLGWHPQRSAWGPTCASTFPSLASARVGSSEGVVREGQRKDSRPAQATSSIRQFVTSSHSSRLFDLSTGRG